MSNRRTYQHKGVTRVVYRCSACGREFVWDDSCHWFGSFKDYENGDYHKIRFACSEECKARIDAEEKPTVRGRKRKSAESTGTGG